MYGAVRNGANSNAQIISGTLTWTFTPASGTPVSVTTPLTDITGQYSYALRVPFASVLGSGTLPTNTLQLNSTATSYVRTNAFLTVNGTNYPASLSAPALGTFTFGPGDRGREDRVDLSVSAPATFAEWLVEFGLPASSGPNSDPTMKGMTLMEQYIAGLNPNDPKSFLQFVHIQPDEQGIELFWSSVAGRLYTLEQGSAVNGPFTFLQTNILATPGTN
jgi:hypothetical protein